MLVRIVRMTFDEQRVDEFLQIFKQSKDKIRSFPGCQHLELHRDYHRPNVYVTYSHWSDDKALEAYRTSELFSSVWEKTKRLFSEPPTAFSNRIEDVID